MNAFRQPRIYTRNANTDKGLIALGMEEVYENEHEAKLVQELEGIISDEDPSINLKELTSKEKVINAMAIWLEMNKPQYVESFFNEHSNVFNLVEGDYILAVDKAIKSSLEHGDVHTAFRILDFAKKYSITNNELKNLKVAFFNGIEYLLNTEEVENAIQLAVHSEEFGIPRQELVRRKKLFIEAAKRYLTEPSGFQPTVNLSLVNYLISHAESFGGTIQDFSEFGSKILAEEERLLRDDNDDYVIQVDIKTLKKLGVAQHELKSFENIVLQDILKRLSSGDLDGAKYLVKEVPLKELTNEQFVVLKNAVLNSIKIGLQDDPLHCEYYIKFSKTFGLTIEDIKSTLIIVTENVVGDDTSSAIEALAIVRQASEYGIAKNEFKQSIFNGVSKLLTRGRLYKVTELMERADLFGASIQEFKSLKDSALKGIEKLLRDGNSFDAQQIIERANDFGIEKTDLKNLRQEFLDCMKKELSEGDIYNVLRRIENDIFGTTLEDAMTFKNEALTGAKNALLGGKIEVAIKYVDSSKRFGARPEDFKGLAVELVRCAEKCSNSTHVFFNFFIKCFESAKLFGADDTSFHIFGFKLKKAIRDFIDFERLDLVTFVLDHATSFGLHKEDLDEIKNLLIEEAESTRKGNLATKLMYVSKAIELGATDAELRKIKEKLISDSEAELKEHAFTAKNSVAVRVLSSSIAFSPDERNRFTQAALQGTERLLMQGAITSAINGSKNTTLISFHKEEYESLRNAALNGLKIALSKGNIYEVLSNIDHVRRFGVKREDYIEFKDAALTGLEVISSKGDLQKTHDLLKRIEFFGLQKEDVANVLRKGIANCLSSVLIDSYNIHPIIELLKSYNISYAELKLEFEMCFQRVLLSGSVEGAVKIFSELVKFGAQKKDFHYLVMVAADKMLMRSENSSAQRLFGYFDDFGLTNSDRGRLLLKVGEHFLTNHKFYDFQHLLELGSSFGITKDVFAAKSVKILNQMIKKDHFDGILNFATHANLLSLTPDVFSEYARQLAQVHLKHRNIYQLVKLIEHQQSIGLNERDFISKEQPRLGRAVFAAVQDFGSHVSQQTIELYIQLSESQHSSLEEPSLQEPHLLGITETGDKGLESLRAKYKELAFAFVRKEQILDPEILAQCPVLIDYLKKLVRFEDAQFGQKDNLQFLSLVQTAKTNHEQGIDRVNPAFTNDFLFVSTASSEKPKIKHEPEALLETNRITTIFRSIDDLASQLRDPKTKQETLIRIQAILDASMQRSLQDLQSLLEKEQERIQSDESMNDRQKQGRLKGLEARQKQYEALTAFKETTIASSINDLFNTPDLDPATRAQKLTSLLTPELTSKGEEYLEPYRDAVRTIYALASALRMPAVQIPPSEKDGTPSLDQANTLLDLTDHVLIQETLGLGKNQEQDLSREEKDYRQAAQRLLKTTHLKKVSEAIQHAQKASTETQCIEIIPSRGLLLEFSGHISDACWASKYNIAKDFPNITNLTFVLKEKDENGHPTLPNPNKDKIAGACLLIEATANDGTPLLIMRGMNPLENTINRLMPKDFVNQLMAYVTKVAEKMGRKPSLVIDSRGEASTNRQAIADVLNGMKNKGEVKQLSLTDSSYYYESHAPTVFNGYKLASKTFHWSTKSE